LFTSYRFEHPVTEQSIMVAGWSYLWAGLFGVFYVRWIGYPKRVLPALLLNVAFVVGLVVVAVTASFLPLLLKVILLLAAIPGLVLGQSLTMTFIIRKSFRRHGWLVRMGR
jgi:hypothetical protein